MNSDPGGAFRGLLLPPAPGSMQPRSISSFLIQDILKGCWSASDPGPLPASFPSEAKEEDVDRSVNLSRRAHNLDGVHHKKPRKTRTAFTDLQLSHLERSFQKQKYLSVQDRVELAAFLHLSDDQVKTWYQNRRTKWKRQAAADLELSVRTDRMFMPPYFLCPAAQSTVDSYLSRGHTPSPACLCYHLSYPTRSPADKD